MRVWRMRTGISITLKPADRRRLKALARDRNKKRAPELKLTSPEDFERQIVAFDQRSEELLMTLASQAGIALENAILYAEINRMLEGFVRASVEAIEQRDPTTSGHSRRVSDFTVGLARAVERESTGPFRDRKSVV